MNTIIIKIIPTVANLFPTLFVPKVCGFTAIDLTKKQNFLKSCFTVLVKKSTVLQMVVFLFGCPFGISYNNDLLVKH